MKKLLGILVLGLLLSGNAYADEKFQGSFDCLRSDAPISYPILIDEVNNYAKWGSFNSSLKVNYDEFIVFKLFKELQILETMIIDRFSGKFIIVGLNKENKNEWEYFGVCTQTKRKF